MEIIKQASDLADKITLFCKRNGLAANDSVKTLDDIEKIIIACGDIPHKLGYPIYDYLIPLPSFFESKEEEITWFKEPIKNKWKVKSIKKHK